MLPISAYIKSAAVELVCSTTVPGGGRSPPDISAYIMPVNSLILNSLFLQAGTSGSGNYFGKVGSYSVQGMNILFQCLILHP